MSCATRSTKEWVKLRCDVRPQHVAGRALRRTRRAVSESTLPRGVARTAPPHASGGRKPAGRQKCVVAQTARGAPPAKKALWQSETVQRQSPGAHLQLPLGRLNARSSNALRTYASCLPSCIPPSAGRRHPTGRGKEDGRKDRLLESRACVQFDTRIPVVASAESREQASWGRSIATEGGLP